jgi:hypothetical protein
MDSGKTYLLKAIINHEKNGYTSFGELHAKHCDDISKLLERYAKESLREFIKLINKGERVDIGDGEVIFLQKRSKKKNG